MEQVVSPSSVSILEPGTNEPLQCPGNNAHPNEIDAKHRRFLEVGLMSLPLFTIGFTQKSAQDFFSRLKSAGVKTVIDTRLNRTSQLSGFAKESDLRFFVRELCNADYRVEASFAPTEPMLKAYKSGKSTWDEYESEFKSLIASRRIERVFDRGQLQSACLLCSEDQPHHCHRRLVAEYLRETLGGIDVVHL